MIASRKRPRQIYRPLRCDRRGRCFTLAATVIAVSLAACADSFGAEATTSDGRPGMLVTATRSERTCFSDTVVVTGSLVARNEILVRPDREGLEISRILAEIGDTVASAQVLAELSAPGQSGSTTPVRAPAAGIVSAAPTVTGTMTSARGDPLFRIIADGEVELAAEIPGAEAFRVAVGQQVRVKVIGMDELPGRVRAVSPTLDAASQLGQLRILLERNPRLRVGAFGRARVVVAQKCGVAVPVSAVLYDPDGHPFVQIVRHDRIETRGVNVRTLFEGKAELSEGLDEGDVVVARAGAFLREGDSVRAVVAGQ